MGGTGGDVGGGDWEGGGGGDGEGGERGAVEGVYRGGEGVRVVVGGEGAVLGDAFGRVAVGGDGSYLLTVAVVESAFVCDADARMRLEGLHVIRVVTSNLVDSLRPWQVVNVGVALRVDLSKQRQVLRVRNQSRRESQEVCDGVWQVFHWVVVQDCCYLRAQQ